MNPTLQSQLQQWLKDMRPTPPREKEEQGDRPKHEDSTFIEKLKTKIAEDARAGRR